MEHRIIPFSTKSHFPGKNCMQVSQGHIVGIWMHHCMRTYPDLQLFFMLWKCPTYPIKSSNSRVKKAWISLLVQLPVRPPTFAEFSCLSSSRSITVFSGNRNFELLSPEEQEFAMNTTVQYAPRAYEWIKNCKATSDGLSIAKKGREQAESDLPEFNWSKVHSFPVSLLQIHKGFDC